MRNVTHCSQTKAAVDMAQTVETTDSAAEIRSELARRMVPVYILAARVGLHPTHLGQVLRGRRDLTPELAARIRLALNEVPDGRV